jgi:hypothetical protein
MLLAAAPVGAEFRVNTTTTDSQIAPVGAMAADGSSVIVWQSRLQDGSGYGIFGQRYDSAGQPLSGEFQVNATAANDQTVPTISMDLAGDFIVAWQSDKQDGDQGGIYARLFSAKTASFGNEFLVNTTTTGAQTAPWAAMDAIGDGIIVWMSASSIFGQRYDLAGAPVGSEFRINSYVNGTQSTPHAAMDANGDFVVAWSSTESPGTHNGVYAQRFDASGAAAGGEIQVSTLRSTPSLGMDAQGNFAVATSDSSNTLNLRLYKADGSANGPARQVNATSDTISNYWASMGPSGEVAVVWQGASSGTLSSTALLQRYNADGSRFSHAVQLNTSTGVTAPSIARSPTGDFLAIWGQSSGAIDVFARRYQSFDNPAAVGDRVWNDANANGIQDPGEANWSGARVQLFTAAGMLVDSVVTLNDGAYRFDDLRPGDSYYIQLSPVPGVISPPFQGGNDLLDSNLDPTTQRTATFSLGPNQGDFTKDIGLFASSVSGNVYNDRNGDGVSQAGEQAMPGWVVNLDGMVGTTPVHATTTTSSFGSFTFGGILLGTFTITVVPQSGWTQTTPASKLTFTRPPNAPGFLSVGMHTDAPDPPAASFAPETQVNTFLANDQSAPAVAVNAVGDAVTVWVSHAQDGTFDGIYGQRMDSAGNRRGSEFRISSSMAGDQREPAVAMDAAGNFIVAWSSQESSGLAFDVQMRRFSAAGQPLGPEVTVNPAPLDSQAEPTLAMNASGSFAIVWDAQASINPAVMVQLFDPTGAARGQAIRVDSQFVGYGGRPAAAMDANGNLAVVWSWLNGSDIILRRLDANGIPLGNEMKVPTPPHSSTTLAPRIAMSPDGRFVVAWQRQDSPTAIYATRFDANGTAQGLEAKIGTSSNAKSQPAITMAADGGYYIAWTEQTSTTGADLRIQAFNSAGVASASIVTINSIIPGDQNAPAIGLDSTGKLLALWTTRPTTTSASDIMATASPAAWLPASIGGVIWTDDNGDGIQQASEKGRQSLTVKLLDGNGATLQTKTTASDGSYRFDGVIPAQTYSIQFSKPTGFLYTLRDVGGDDSIDSDADRTTGLSASLIPSSGQVNLTVSAGIALPANIAITVFVDANQNGSRDPGEFVVPSATIYLDLNANGGFDAGEPSQVTNASGQCTFSSLDVGSYIVRVLPLPHLNSPPGPSLIAPLPGAITQIAVPVISDAPLTITAPLGPEMRLPDYANQGDGLMAVAYLPSGEFWGLYLSGGNLFLDQFGTDGQQQSSRVVDQLQLGSNQDASPSLGITPSGDLIAAWVNHYDGEQIRAQRFDPQGTPRGPAFVVMQGANGVIPVSEPALAVGPAGISRLRGWRDIPVQGQSRCGAIQRLAWRDRSWPRSVRASRTRPRWQSMATTICW